MIILAIALFIVFLISFVVYIRDKYDDVPRIIPLSLFIFFCLAFFNINVKTVKTNITIAPFKDSTSIIIKYKDEVMIKNDHKLYILDSIKIVYIQEYGFTGVLDTYIELNKCYN
jgi:hypothetical protein